MYAGRLCRILGMTQHRRKTIAQKPRGNTQGLKPNQLKKLGKLYQRRYAEPRGFSADQARELAELTRDTGRQIGLLIDRQGKPDMVLVGDTQSIYIPELPRSRLGTGRLRGIRLLHTHLHSPAGGELLTQDDLMDMAFLRLDSVICLTVTHDGRPGRVQLAHLLPGGPVADPDAKGGGGWEVLPDVAWDRFDTDLPAQVQALEDEFSRVREEAGWSDGDERVLLVSVSTAPKGAQEAALDELASLAETAGLVPAGTMIQRVRQANPRHILGKGKLMELEVRALGCGARLIVFDQDLSPAQARNLAGITERRVIDRTQLILDIFAQRAKSKAGKLQVELAQLKYLLPRLTGAGKAMSRLVGGIGTRGPGETKLEQDRRRARERMARLSKELAGVRGHRGRSRERRAKAGVPVVALVGYTNAGKSTLLNTLTHSGVPAEDKLFATLDPTSRRIRFPEEREVILTDTVGFIRRLPEDLKEAFRATLEELEAADLLVLVADASHVEVEEQVAAVEAILADMGLSETPRIMALNKWDRLDQEDRERMGYVFPGGVPVSALDRPTLAPLVAAVLARLPVSVRTPQEVV